MRFRIAKPASRMSFGDLFYTQPSENTELWAMAELRYICEEETKNGMEKRVLRELEAIKKTNNAMGVLIMAEIAYLSKELGYPVMLYGNESGLYIMELLGISGLTREDYENSEIPSELCVNDMLSGKSYNFTLGIAEPVREHIQKRLDRRFGHMESDNSLYRCIDLPGWDVLEYIGEISKESEMPINEAQNYDMWIYDKLYSKISNDEFGREIFCPFEGDGPMTPYHVSKLYAFARSGAGEDVLLSDVRNYVFRDDVYRVLREKGCTACEAMRLSKGAAGKRKAENTELLRQFDLPQNFFYCYEALGYHWTVTACLSRVKMLALLYYFERSNNQLYKEITQKKNDSQH